MISSTTTTLKTLSLSKIQIFFCFLMDKLTMCGNQWACILDCTIQLQRRRQWHPTPVLLPGKSRGQRSLVGCSPWGREELDMTERLPFHFSLSCIGEGNGNPLQCSCLENPRDGGSWWAAVYGVAQSRTQLKWLSSSSSSSREKGVLLHCWWECNWYSHYEKWYGDSLKN